VARDDATEERQARAVGERAKLAPNHGASLTANDAAGGTTLSGTGRRYFEPLVGSAVSRARLHVDERSDRLTRLAGAKALTYGNDVFIPQDRFAPESVEGRALLGHELAHVAQPQNGRPQLFRQSVVEPHYPTEDEQRKIEKLLSREFKATAAMPPAAPNQPAVQRGRSLNEQERQALAGRLEQPFFQTLDRLDTGASGSSSDVLNEADAFGVAVEARDAIVEKFGSYLSRPFTLTQDQTTTRASRHTNNQVLVQFSVPPDIVDDVARTVSTTHCTTCLAELAELDSDSRRAVINALVQAALQSRAAQLQRIATARVPGAYNRFESRASLRLKPRDAFYKTTVHELIHAAAHPVWNAAFRDEDNLNEGFTEYFTQKVVGSVDPSYKERYEKVVSVRDAMAGPFVSPVGGSPDESMRLAYFRGRLDLIGWRPSGPDEEQLVKRAVDPANPEEGKQWDATTARRYAKIYQAAAVAKQAASRNVLGVGLYFTKDSDDSIAVRYARVIARTEPYAKGQLLLEGQVLGSPLRRPSGLGASLGVAAEYQQPYFYLQGGVRFVGAAAPAGGANRLDVSAFAGGGIRAWQTLRVGVEGFVAVPVLAGQDRLWGGVVTVGIEIK
jgi:hypothetical protein